MDANRTENNIDISLPNNFTLKPMVLPNLSCNASENQNIKEHMIGPSRCRMKKINNKGKK